MVHPTIEALQISEIASINNRVFRTMGSPLLLPKHHHCDIFSRKDQRLLLTVDHNNIPVDDLISVRCQVSDKKSVLPGTALSLSGTVSVKRF